MTQPAGVDEVPSILVVDDTPANLQLLAGMLKERGYRVRPVPDGPLALQAARKDPPAIILLDIDMPQMSGFEVCAELKADERLADIPVIFISAIDETLDKVKAFSVGGVDYVTKPFQFDEVEARVKAHLKLRQLQLQLEARNRELEESHERLRELARVREGLTQMIVHDLKNPLTAAIANGQFLLGALAGGLREAAQDTLDACQRMQRMVLDVLDVARSDQVGLVLRREPLALGTLVEETLGARRSAVHDGGHRLVGDVAADLGPVVADREILRRVLDNLLDNATKYAPRGTEIRLEARREAGQLCIRVRDQGVGVPEQHRSMIFEPYVRLDDPLGVQGRSSQGLGLAFCRLAAEAHGGRIWVEDNQPSGSVFCLLLPLRSVL